MTWKKTPPASGYYAVIFCSTKSEDLDGYEEMDALTLKLAEEQPGFLGFESVSKEGEGIFISYWESMDAIHDWRGIMTHLKAKSNARLWYKRYLSQICKVEHSHLFEDK